MVTLTNRVNIILDTDDEVIDQQEINDLASCFLKKFFFSNIELFLNTAQWRMIGNKIKNLIMKYDSIKYNMVYLSSYLVSVFRKIVEQSSIPPNELKFKLHLFIDTIREYEKDFDNVLWEKWFLYDGMFADMVFFWLVNLCQKIIIQVWTKKVSLTI